ncbi:MAG: MFS transporter, partial [Nanoarchaeota archaeon]
MKTKRNIFLWILYDFANSIMSIVFFLYFAQWVVIDRGVSDFYFNITFTISAILLFFTAPLAGSLLDKSWRRITGIRYTTILTLIFYGLCAFYAISNKEIYALIFFTLGLYFYLLSFTFYTPLLNDIAKPEKRGLVSGLGINANYL